MIKGSEVREAGHPIERLLLDRWSPRTMWYARTDSNRDFSAGSWRRRFSVARSSTIPTTSAVYSTADMEERAFAIPNQNRRQTDAHSSVTFLGNFEFPTFPEVKLPSPESTS
jgi:hypothetical protein